MNTLRFDIREIVLNADSKLTLGDIHAALRRNVKRGAVSVTVANMCSDRQLRRSKAPKHKRVQGTLYVDGPGPEPVIDVRGGRYHGQRMKGFMELARERNAKEKAAATK